MNHVSPNRRNKKRLLCDADIHDQRRRLRVRIAARNERGPERAGVEP
jgi:hypothetical protein